MYQSIPSGNIPRGNLSDMVKFPCPPAENLAKMRPPGKKSCTKTGEKFLPIFSNCDFYLIRKRLQTVSAN